MIGITIIKLSSNTQIAVQGCSHGELDKIYDSVVQSESHTGKKVDLLICCGDFQVISCDVLF